MSHTTIDTELRSRIEPLIAELVELMKRTAVRAVAVALEGAPVKPTLAHATPAPESPPRTRARASRPTSAIRSVSLDDYERMAIQRALAESGDVLAAGEQLGIGKSTIYRRMRALGIPRTRRGAPIRVAPDDPVAAANVPASLEAYEKAALQRAVDESSGDKRAAAKLLGVSKSAIYRKLSRHGIE